MSILPKASRHGESNAKPHRTSKALSESEEGCILFRASFRSAARPRVAFTDVFPWRNLFAESCSQVLLIIQNGLRCGLAHFELCTHFL